MGKTVVIALGGNAILQPKQRGTVDQQRENIDITCRQIVRLIEKGYNVIVAHGNGPQVGNLLIQQESAIEKVPAMTLDICGAMTQGQIGYMIQQSLGNFLAEAKINGKIATVITQVIVDGNDKAFTNPTKPVGPFFSQAHAEEMINKGETWIEDSGRGWRKVVPSPEPIGIVEKDIIKLLVEHGTIVVAAGGGGIPVRRENAMHLGAEGVIDKDLASYRLAMDVGADIFMILTDVTNVAINYGKETQRNLSLVSVSEMEGYSKEGHFKAGSMGPKVEAAIRFVKSGRDKAIITSLDSAIDALDGKSGTVITK